MKKLSTYFKPKKEKEIQDYLVLTKFVDSSLKEEFEIKIKNKSQIVEFLNFNANYSTQEFYSNIKMLNEVFQLEFVQFHRLSLKKIIGVYSNWNMKYEVPSGEICLGINGLEKIKIPYDIGSIYVFGKSGRGKSTYIKSLINSYSKFAINPRVVIISKKLDFKEDYPEAEQLVYDEKGIKRFNEILDEVENHRAKCVKYEKHRMFYETIIVCDEFQFLENEREILKKLYEFIRLGRSKLIRVILGSQSGLSSQFKELNINQMAVKVLLGQPESKAFAQTLFPSDLAEIITNEVIQKGFAYINTEYHQPQKIKLHYEPKPKI